MIIFHILQGTTDQSDSTHQGIAMATGSQPHSHLNQSDFRNHISDSQGTNGNDLDYSLSDRNEESNSLSRPVSEFSSVSCSRYKDLNGSRPVSNMTGSESQSTFSRPYKRPSSSIIEALEYESEMFSCGLEQGSRLSDIERISPLFDVGDTISDHGSDDSMRDSIDFDPLYQEVDQNHESVYELKKSAPPQIRIERKIFQERMDSFVSSSNDSEDMLERERKFPLYATIDKKPTMQVEPMTRHGGDGQTSLRNNVSDFGPQARSSGFAHDPDLTLTSEPCSPSSLSVHSPHSPQRSPVSERSERSLLGSSSSPRSPPPISGRLGAPYSPPPPPPQHSNISPLLPLTSSNMTSPLTPQLPDLISSPPTLPRKQHSSITQSSSSTNTVSAIATLPRRPLEQHTTQPLHFSFEDPIDPSRTSRSKVESQVIAAEVHSAPATVSRPATRGKQPSPPATRGRLHTWVSHCFYFYC